MPLKWDRYEVKLMKEKERIYTVGGCHDHGRKRTIRDSIRWEGSSPESLLIAMIREKLKLNQILQGERFKLSDRFMV
jgi:hypothetical protein